MREPPPAGWRFNLGAGQWVGGFLPVAPTTLYEPRTGYGWIPGPRVQAGELEAPDVLRRGYLWSRGKATFRIDVPPGRYRVSVLIGDRRVGEHGLRFSIRNGSLNEFPPVEPCRPGRQMTLMADVSVGDESTDLLFSPLGDMWVVNALQVEPIDQAQETRLVEEQVWLPVWGDFRKWPDPVKPHRERFEAHLRGSRNCAPSGLSESDYLKILIPAVCHLARFQAESGAIIDPYEKDELQYSTPAFALAAACAAVHGTASDLLEPAARAMDHSTRLLAEAGARHGHEDFFPPMVARAFRLLRGAVAEERAKEWLRRIRAYDPHRTYRFGQGGGNWNVVALAGEGLYEIFGLRNGMAYAEEALERQAHRFTHWGMYLDINSEAMAYDHFPRLWLADLLASGYSGRLADGLREYLERGAWTSLFLQSPAGDLPTGGRSAQHQWNEAAQCVTFEVFASIAMREGNSGVAGAFKRAARLSLGCLRKWVRPEGDLWIVKNRVDPAARHGYEPYSFYSQYNLLPMAVLAIAYEHSLAAAGIEEAPAPAEIGGFVLDLREHFHKVVANAAGSYVEIDTSGVPEYDPTGLLRIHFLDLREQVGPGDGLVSGLSGTTAAIGVAWRSSDGHWRRLAEFQKSRIEAPALEVLSEREAQVSFRLTYRGNLDGADAVTEQYRLASGSMEVGFQVSGSDGPLRILWPVLVRDGEREAVLTIEEDRLRVEFGGSAQLFTASGCCSLRLLDPLHPCRNGWAKVAEASFEAGIAPRLKVTPID